MSRFADRPWGRLDWVLDHSTSRDWHVISSLGAEERCFAAVKELATKGRASHLTLINIVEPDGHPGAGDIRQSKTLRERELAADPLSGVTVEMSTHQLLEPYHRIVEATKSAGAVSENVWLDISTMPKRFFFPMLRTLLRLPGVQNLMVSYSMAESYAESDLHQDIQTPEFLPLFGPDLRGERRAKGLVVSIGFESSGVIQILEQSDYSPITVLFSYPAPPPFFGKNWDFVRYAAKSIPQKHLDLEGVSVIDVPSVFDTLDTKMANGEISYICAPFGPKPVSLAMCLYAAGPGSERAAIMYTQPKYYNPAYSLGVREDGSGPVIYAYPVVIEGINRYAPT